MCSIEEKIQKIMNDTKTQKFSRIKKILSSEDLCFLDTHYEDSVSLEEQIFLFYRKKKKEEYRCICGKQTSFHTLNRGFNKVCSMSCHAKNSANFHDISKRHNILPILEKICITCQEKFKTKLESRIACSKSCGAIYNQKIKTPEERMRSQDKRETTSLAKYGDKHHINSEHCRNKTLEKLGVKYSWQSKDVLQGIRDRYKEKTGYDNPFKNPEVTKRMIATKIEKYGGLDSFNHYKTYIFPSGNIAKVQGYEPKALDQLLQTYEESDLAVGRDEIKSHIGNVKYFSEKTGKMHYYYPDIYVISEKRVIEVKSKWTYEKQLDTNQLKKQAVLDMGLNFDFMIY